MPITDYKEMTTEEFDQALIEAINEDNAQPSELLKVPGVYETLSEHYNNRALDIWVGKRYRKEQ